MYINQPSFCFIDHESDQLDIDYSQPSSEWVMFEKGKVLMCTVAYYVANHSSLTQKLLLLLSHLLKVVLNI